MTAASRAACGLVVAVVLFSGIPEVATAAETVAGSPTPQCPAVVADQPLSVSTPFSATVRPRSDDEGRVVAISLLCAYGEGAEPAVEVLVAWETTGDDPCATAEAAVAPTLDPGPFDALATDLVEAVGGPCAPTGATGWALPAGGAAVVAAVGLTVLWHRRRRTRHRAASVVPDDEGRTARGSAAVPDDGGRAARASAPTGAASPAIGALGALTTPDPGPALAALRDPAGRRFAGSGPGQMAALAAIAYARGDTVTGDLARAGTLCGLGHGGSPRSAVAVLARRLAHQDRAGGR